MHGALDVVRPVRPGSFHRLTDALVGGEVDDRIDIVITADTLDQRLIRDVADDELRAEQ